MTIDPISSAIEAAVSRAVAAHMKSIENNVMARVDARLKSLKRPAEMPPPELGERIVSTAEAAKILGVHKTTLLRYEAKGALPKRLAMPGGRTGFRMSELHAFIEALPEASGEVVVTNPNPRGKAVRP